MGSLMCPFCMVRYSNADADDRECPICGRPPGGGRGPTPA